MSSSQPKEKTSNEMQFDENKLISLKENFTGQKFQWIKTDRPELLGKVVKCRDIYPNRMGGFDVTFDDGSKVDSAKLNSSLMMIHGEMQPLSKSEVESIYGKNLQKPKVQAPLVQTPVQTPVQSPVQTPVQPFQTPAPQATVSKSNMFAMFNSEETQVSLTVKVKLPDKKLLKMMYASAENKDAFLEELSEYLQSVINKQVISDSMRESLDPTPVKKKEVKPAVPQIEVREV